jgi:hypothetical protein
MKSLRLRAAREADKTTGETADMTTSRKKNAGQVHPQGVRRGCKGLIPKAGTPFIGIFRYLCNTLGDGINSLSNHNVVLCAKHSRVA